MEDTDGELRRVLVENVKKIKRDYRYDNVGGAFQHWAAVHVLGIADDDVQIGLGGKTGKDMGIDYFHKNDEAGTVEIVQAKFHENLSSGASREDLCSFFMTVDRLKKSDGGSDAFKECQRQYRKAVSDGFETKLIFVIAGSLTKENREEIRVCEENSPGDVSFQYLETRDLLGLIGNPNSPRCTLELCGDEKFVGDGAGGGIRKMAATVKAEELKRIYEEIGAPVLFSANPKYFLSERVKISKQIQKTLRDCPERLWHYNNGISAICKRFQYKEESNSLVVENLKIVNGCQTITTIGKYGPPIKGEATLLFRLSEVDDEDFRAEISRNTNNQNRTQPTDLNADRKELRLLEHRFKEYPNFFWERKRGQFEAQKGKKPGVPKSKSRLHVFSNVTAARLKLAYELEAPHQSLQLSQEKIFEDYPITSSSRIRPFPDIYENADPLDFVLPNIFYYCLGEMRSPGAPGQDLALADLNIGKYYVVAVIGKTLRAVPPGERGELVRRIVKAAADQDPKIGELTAVLAGLVDLVAKCLASVLDNNRRQSPDGYDGFKPLSGYKPEELKHELREEGVFEALYREIEKMVAMNNRRNVFEEELKKLFGL